MSDERLPDLYARALELDAPGRRALLDRVAVEEAALAVELERLLAPDVDAPSPLDRSPWQEPGEAAESSAPRRLGPYRVLRELGRGGMGRVYLAEQEGEGFRRRVALKVVEPRGPDGTTPELERRVRAERRILAALEHPGIARFYDAGRDSGGAWYLALEYVEGHDLLDHVHARGLGLLERLRLFLEVVDAVAYAHSREVVHRDLKPSNILVGPDGRPRLLDFGIAKLLAVEPGAPLTETRAEHRALTPAYASPEQFRGDRVTAASDVFSLGILLYELIADVRPFAPDTGSSIELERAVLSEEPAAPSSAARRHGPGEAGGGEPLFRAPRRRLARTGPARRDLDAICLRALNKAPRDRYRSAAELGADLRAYLEGRPVAARGAGVAYRIRRWARRRRGALTGGAALVAVAALAVAFLLERSRTGLGHGSATAATAAPAAPTAAPSWTGVDEVPLDELRRRFSAAPESLIAGAQLATGLANRGEPAEAAIVIGRLRQLPGAPEDPLVNYAEGVVATHLDEPQRALALFSRALAAAGPGAPGGLLSRIRAGRSRSLSDLGQSAAAETELSAAAEDARRAADAPALAVVLNDLAVGHMQRGDYATGERLLEEALAAAVEARDRPRVGLIQQNLGGLAYQRGRPDLAEERYREAIRLFEQVARERRAASARADLSLALWDQGRAADADTELDAAIERLRRLDNESALADALAYRAQAAIERARLADAETIAAEMESGARASGNPTSLGLAEITRARAAAARGEAGARTRFAAARRLFAESGYLDLASDADVAAASAQLDLAESSEAVDRFAAVEELLATAGTAGTAGFVAVTLRARLDAEHGHPSDASERLRSLGATSEQSPSLTRRLAFLSARAAVADAERRFDAARLDLVTAARDALAGDRKLEELRLRLRLVDLERRSGDPAAAERAAESVRGEASALGLAGLAARAGARR